LLSTTVRRAWKSDQGFTLLETLAVMVIVGLLAAITVPQISNWRNAAQATAVKADLRVAALAMEGQNAEMGVYPSSIPTFVNQSNGVTLTLAGGALSSNDEKFVAMMDACNATPGFICEWPYKGDPKQARWKTPDGLASWGSDLTRFYDAATASGFPASGRPPYMYFPDATTNLRPLADANTFCITGTHAKVPSAAMHWRAGSGMAKGAC
jgi:prepilin-type N-terminal cleavage/methylation domain-containing protein